MISKKHCCEMSCCFIVTGSPCNSFVRAKYSMFGFKNLFLLRGQRKLLTSGPGSQGTIIKQLIAKCSTFKAIERTFPTNSSTKSYLLQDRSFISTNERHSNSSSNEVSKEMENEQTKVTIINDQRGTGKMYLPYIYKYSKIGFTIGKNKVIGSVALFPGGMLSWKVASYLQITPESLAIFPLMDPRLEILILGVGDKVVQVPKSVWDFARTNKVSLEVLDTPNACATYNFLTEEGRRTAAALIPPQDIKT